MILRSKNLTRGLKKIKRGNNLPHIKLQSILLILFVILSTCLLIRVPPVASQNNYVIIEPREPESASETPYSVVPGQQVMINISIQNAVEIYGYNLTISFLNPDILEFVSFRYMPFLEKPYVTKDVHPVGGKITVYAKSEPPAKPVSGSGTLITLIFTAKALGETTIKFEATDCWLIKEDGTKIHPSTYKRGKVAVTNTWIAIEPHRLEGNVSEIINAKVTVYNVKKLYGIEINITWNPEILNLIYVRYQVPWENKFELTNETGKGYYALAVAALYPEEPYTGNYTIINFQFNITKIGLTPISFKTSKLGDVDSEPLPHAKVAGIFSNVELTVGFDPSSIVDANLVKGEKFNVTLVLTKVSTLKKFNLTILYPEILNFSRFFFNEKLILLTKGYKSDLSMRTLTVWGEFVSEIEYSRRIEIAAIEFEIRGYRKGYIEIDTSVENYLKDDKGNSLPFNLASCFFMNWRNVGITQLKFSSELMAGKNFVVGEPINIQVRVDNSGASDENVTLTISYEGMITVNGNTTKKVNGTIYEGNFILSAYGSENSSVVLDKIFWNTTGLDCGEYTVVVKVTIGVDHSPEDNSLQETITLIELPVDIAVVNVLVLPSDNVDVNETLYIAVVVSNYGLKDEIFDLLVYFDGDLVRSFEKVSLAAKTGDIFFMELKIPTQGRHVLNFTIPAVEGEKKLDNNFKFITLEVGLAGALPPHMIIGLIALVVVAVTVTVVLYVRRGRRKAIKGSLAVS